MQMAHILQILLGHIAVCTIHSLIQRHFPHFYFNDPGAKLELELPWRNISLFARSWHPLSAISALDGRTFVMHTCPFLPVMTPGVIWRGRTSRYIYCA